MKHPKQLLAVLLMAAACTMQAQRSEALLEKNWSRRLPTIPKMYSVQSKRWALMWNGCK